MILMPGKIAHAMEYCQIPNISPSKITVHPSSSPLLNRRGEGGGLGKRVRWVGFQIRYRFLVIKKFAERFALNFSKDYEFNCLTKPYQNTRKSVSSGLQTPQSSWVIKFIAVTIDNATQFNLSQLSLLYKHLF